MHTEVSSVQVFGQRDRWPEHVAYVGMPCKPSRAFGIPDAEGIFGKPWSMFHAPDWEIVYSDYMAKRLLVDEAFALAVKSLHGKTLLCYCSRKAEQRGVEVACHARILAEYVELLFHAKR